MFLLKASAGAEGSCGTKKRRVRFPREREIKGRQESEVARWMVACCGARWALMCAGEEDEGMDGLAASG